MCHKHVSVDNANIDGLYQAPVVRRLDNAIQRISVDKTNHAIRWIVIYPVDSVIHLSNDPSQVFKLTNGR